MHRCGLELPFDDEIGLLEAGLDVALLDLERLAIFEGFSGLGSTPTVKRSSCSNGASGRMASTTSIT